MDIFIESVWWSVKNSIERCIDDFMRHMIILETDRKNIVSYFTTVIISHPPVSRTTKHFQLVYILKICTIHNVYIFDKFIWTI
jgi:predicted SnoaL-like aldol condensation-catalyzing enzyme